VHGHEIFKIGLTLFWMEAGGYSSAILVENLSLMWGEKDVAFYIVLGLLCYFQERKPNVTLGTVCTLYLTGWKCPHVQRLNRVLQCPLFRGSLNVSTQTRTEIN